MGNTFGENLRRIREERGLPQEQFAKILNTSKQVISRYETGQRSPKINVVSEYSKKLNIDISELTGYTEKLAANEADGLDAAKEYRVTADGQRIGHLYDKADERDKRLVETILEPYAADYSLPLVARGGKTVKPTRAARLEVLNQLDEETADAADKENERY